MSFINKFFSNKGYGVVEPNQMAVVESDISATEEISAKHGTPVLYEKKIEKDWRTITAYKGMSKNMVCRDMQYEVGQTYTIPEEEVKMCRGGYHACIRLADVALYYPIFTSRFFEVEIEYCPDDIYDYHSTLYNNTYIGSYYRADSKFVGRKISILKELSEKEIRLQNIMSFETFLEWRRDNKGLSDNEIISRCKNQEFQRLYEQAFGYVVSDDVDEFFESLGFDIRYLDEAIKILKNILTYHVEAPASIRMMIFYKQLENK